MDCRDEMDRINRDAARYRWLCEYPNLYTVNDLLKADQYVTLTRAVDALMECERFNAAMADGEPRYTLTPAGRKHLAGEK